MTEKKEPFSISKGYSFIFEDDGASIEAWFSAFSGHEKIFVNGELISSQRNYSTSSSSTFTIGENRYSTSLHVENVLKGPFVCTLSKNGKPCKRQRLVFPGAANRKWIRQFIFLILLGLALGACQGYFKFSDTVFYSFLGVMVFLFFLLSKPREYGSIKPLIEDVEVD